jgi:hypothetical protein
LSEIALQPLVEEGPDHERDHDEGWKPRMKPEHHREDQEHGSTPSALLTRHRAADLSLSRLPFGAVGRG